MNEMSRPTVRRVITGHRQDGLAVVVEDEFLPHSELAEEPGRTDAAFFHLWATTAAPVPLGDEALLTQREGSRATAVGTGTGSVLRIGMLAPGARSPMHRTQTLDYGICLEGECDMELDSGDSVTIHAGDVVVQRGTNHVWHNRSEKPCRFAWILLDAEPVTIAGEQLGASWLDDSRH